MAGRNSRLSNPDFAKSVGEAYAAGMSRKEMAEHFNCHIDTVTVWVRDPRVQAHAGRFAIERINRITRKIDETIDGRLAHASKMDTELLLKIRKEFLERVPQMDVSQLNLADTTGELQEALDQNPDLAKDLKELLEATTAPAPAE